jgi:hypothetical protein
MGTIALVGLSLYLMIKRNPLQSKNLLLYANNMVKYMPIDKSSMDMISPIIDFTTGSSKSFMENFNDENSDQPNNNMENRLMQSGGVAPGNCKATKRSVSETKKNT